MSNPFPHHHDEGCFLDTHHKGFCRRRPSEKTLVVKHTEPLTQRSRTYTQTLQVLDAVSRKDMTVGEAMRLLGMEPH